MIQAIFENIEQIANPTNNKTMPLAAIWLPEKLKIHKGEERRIKEGYFVYVEEGKLKDLPDKTKPTHMITGCYGKIGDTDIHITAINLKTLELIRINL